MVTRRGHTKRGVPCAGSHPCAGSGLKFHDVSERGRSTESVVNQCMDTVRPMHKQFIEPTKRNADVILPHGANGPAVDIITTKVRSLLQEMGRG
ncbi:hypothetical protein [Paucibacter sp. DJ2R-2]|uniref:hypothetical protein n=1 Tax=Paucibacter sp. DJ2R-2 TaxID=2893558 RepID=UPI0021E3BF09|nr:hypothetical protein [Paucibacter sp. DJ2R-2]MCV2420011.1 hypothetical protein [Paucibacter sp. DJ4R-1]MCV2437062.1 hypothetical protein [Paucibacter sp. DJ2R-2]